jgi:UDP-N-acetylmuramoyl-L-alanyl-D-glutamate--2,6-diaminopimelate ligase
MKLKELIKNLEFVDILGNRDIEVSGISYDSRKVKKNDIFVCIIGTKLDGHDYIQQAIDQGASACIIEKDIKEIEGFTLIKVENARKALAMISAIFFGNPTQNMDIIGVTGTNGKTTITHLIQTILESNGTPSGLIGTIAYQILHQIYESKNTTPESFELQKLFKQMSDSKVKTCVMEVSSHALDMNRIAGINFKIGVFTNLTPDHMDYHMNMQNYKKAKIKLFYHTSLANVINIDDPYGLDIAQEIKGLKPKLITYGIKEKADIYAKNIGISAKGTTFTLVTPKFEGRLKIAIPGLFSVYNALAAIAVCYALGYNIEQIQKGIQSITGVPGRFELVQNTGEYTIIVDYAHTPDALANVLNTIRTFATDKMITVFGCGGDRDKLKRPMMGEIAGNLSDYCILTSDNPRSEDPYAIIQDIEAGIKNTNCKYKIVVDRKEAIREALQISKSKDIILIAGKGHETYQILRDKKIDFDDRRIAQELLREENK